MLTPRREPWREVSDADWTSYRWQMTHRIETADQLKKILKLSKSEQSAVERRTGRFVMGIPPYWANLMDPEDPNCPIRMQAVPVQEEYRFSPNDLVDPLCEDDHMPVPGLVHRYPDRVLLLAVEVCSMYCRFCTRSRVVGTASGFSRPTNLDAAIDYIARTPQIRDVLISGGDPLTLSDDRLDRILTQLKRIPHIEFVRIGTRNPISLPFRITDNLCRMLKSHQPVWMSVNVSHPKELTPEVETALGRLADAGIPLGSQTVLLKGINDDPVVMRRLMHRLLQNRVRPYYLYQCDPVKGTSHFRTPVSKGLEIIESLRGHTTGYAVPTFVVDAPGGGGKIPLMPDYVVEKDSGRWIFRNFSGRKFSYIEESSGVVSNGRVLDPEYQFQA